MRRLKLLTAIALFATTALAADRPYLPDEPGNYPGLKFNAAASSVRESKAAPADVKAIAASAKRLAAIIEAAPKLNPPRGFNFFIVATLVPPDTLQARSRGAATLPLDLWVRFGAPHLFERDGRVASGLAEQLDFYFNDVRPVILDHNSVRKWEDDQGDIYLEPPITGDIAGFPIYKDLLVITRPGESIWAPVSVERFAKAWMPQLRSTPAALAAAEAALASLDAAGRKAPACVTGADRPGLTGLALVPAGTAGCRPIVQANLAILRPKLPRGAIQLITVENINRCREILKNEAKERASPGDCNANLEVVRQIDWKQVAALIAP